MARQLSDSLDRARGDARLSHGELWMRYFELGGMSTELQLEGFLYGALRPTANDYDGVAHALDERLVEIGGNHTVAYSEEINAPEEEATP